MEIVAVEPALVLLAAGVAGVLATAALARVLEAVLDLDHG